MSEDTILAAIAALDAKVTTLDGKFTSLDGKVTTLDGKVASLDGRFTALDAKVTTFRVDVLERFERVENRLTAVQDDITVSMGRADRAHDASISVRDELRLLSTEVSVLTRKTRRLEAQIHDLTKPQD